MSAVAEIEGLAQWMWESYASSSWDVPYVSGEKLSEYEILIEAQAVRRVTVHDGTTIEFHPALSMTMTNAPPSTTIRKSVKVWIFPEESVEDTHLFWRVSQNLANLLSFLTCRHLGVKSLLAYVPDVREDRHLIVTESPRKVIPTSETAEGELTLSDVFADYRQISDSFEDIVNTWFRIYHECEYGLDLYFSNSVERSNRYVSTRFAVAVMAFEALYRGLVGPADKLNRMLIERMARCGSVFGADEDIDTRASRIARMRNDVVHGRQVGQTLPYHSREVIDTCFNVESLCQMLILDELGFSIEEMVERNQSLARGIRIPRNFQGKNE